MRALLRFLIKYHVFLLFILLEVSAFTFLFSRNYYQKSKFVSFTERLSGNYYVKVFKWREYFSLAEENERLSSENIYLKNKLQAYQDSDATLYFGVTDTIYKQHYYYLGAKIINNSINKQHNFIILNKGANLGIEREMAVVSNNGIVGVVSSVSENFATVISLLHTDLRISAKLKKNDYFGSLSWDGRDYTKVVLTEIPYHVDVAKGDTIITSGYSTIFPEGELIGFVDDFVVKDGNFYTITVRLSNDFKNLTFVKVISNLKKNEQLILEQEND